MRNINSIEDLFLEFIDQASKNGEILNFIDITASQSFYNSILANTPLTKNQGRYIVSILKKHKIFLQTLNYDIDNLLETLPWKKEFRIIDNSKKATIDFSEDNIPWIYFQFPYSLKSAFDSYFKDHPVSLWDPDMRVRKMPLYLTNFLKVEEFLHQHNFELSQEFLSYKDQIDDIWQNQEDYEPFCEIVEGKVVLINAVEESEKYWEEHSSGILDKDLMLAKSMGFVLKTIKPTTLIEKVSASSSNFFWTKKISTLFEMYKKTDSKICLILDRSSEYQEWLIKFVESADSFIINRSDIKVCFREDKKTSSNLNQWIKDNGVGGKVVNGKIFVFLNSPAKWFYKDIDSFKIIVTNGLFPNNSRSLQNLLLHHPCVVNVSDIQPSLTKDMKIEEL